MPELVMIWNPSKRKLPLIPSSPSSSLSYLFPIIEKSCLPASHPKI